MKTVRNGAAGRVRSSDSGGVGEHIDTYSLNDETAPKGQEKFFCCFCPPGVEFAGKSEGTVHTLQIVQLVAASKCDPVLILGESGAGKEPGARAVHFWRYGDFTRFVPINCATLSANLLESELFGYVKGAFTGADREKTGLFEQARGGSIFLDEIGEMPTSLQAKLLRVIQQRTFRKVGGTEDTPIRVSIIASTNKLLLEAVEQGKFRKDLYYRLAVFPIVIPPLRDHSRSDDIVLLGEYFLDNPRGVRRFTLSEGAKHRLMEHDWPGNVRELRNVIERAKILEKGPEITPANVIFDHHFDSRSLTPVVLRSVEDSSPGKDFSLQAAERELIIRALRETSGRRTQAAALLGITRATLHAKLKRYQIDIPAARKKSGVLSGQ